MRQTAVLQAKNAFEILSRLPKHGLGSKLSRTSWTDDCYWTISKVRVSTDGKHGKAYGVLTWRGEAQRPEAPTEIAGPLKPVWRLLQEGEAQQAWQSSNLAALLKKEQRAAAAATSAAAAAAAEQTAAA